MTTSQFKKGLYSLASLPPKDITLLDSAAHTATTTSKKQINEQGSNGVFVTLDLTAISGSPSLTLSIQGQDPASGKYYDMLVSAAITAIGTYTFFVCLGMTEIANQVRAMPLPSAWRVKIAHGTSDSVTYSVGATLINL